MTYTTSEHRPLYLSLLQQSTEAWQATHIEEAMSCLDVAYEILPDAPEALAYRCALAELRGEAEEAVLWIGKLQELTQDEGKTAQLFTQASEAFAHATTSSHPHPSLRAATTRCLRRSLISQTPSSTTLSSSPR